MSALDAFPDNLDFLDLKDSSHYTMDSVLAVANGFSKGETLTPVEYPRKREIQNLDIFAALVAAYAVLFVFGMMHKSD